MSGVPMPVVCVVLCVNVSCLSLLTTQTWTLLAALVPLLLLCVLARLLPLAPRPRTPDGDRAAGHNLPGVPARGGVRGVAPRVSAPRSVAFSPLGLG